MTIDENLNFAWHLDMVTKSLKPFILTVDNKNNFEMPEIYDCISYNKYKLSNHYYKSF